MKSFLKVLSFLSAGIIGGYLLLVLVFCLPVGRMHNNVLKSASSFNGEYTVLIDDNIATRQDDWTDALMLLTAGDYTDRNPFTSAVYAYHPERKDVPPHSLISDPDNQANKPTQYSRYWHGYLLFLKPLLFFFTYSQIQVFMSFVVITLLVLVIYFLQKKKLEKYIAPYVITMLLIYPVVISLSMQFLVVYALLNLALIYILLRFEKDSKKNRFFYIFLTIGMATCYFDFLTYPVATLGIPLTVWLILENRKKAMKLSKNAIRVVLGGIAWVVGYFGIWVGKWAFGSLITRQNLFDSAMKAAETRSSSAAFSEEISRFSPIAKTFEVVFSEPVLTILGLAIIVLIVLIFFKKIKIDKKKLIDNLWMLMIALIPLVWYLVFANHSESHVFFTYRTISVLIFAVGCYVASALSRLEKAKKGKKKNG